MATRQVPLVKWFEVVREQVTEVLLFFVGWQPSLVLGLKNERKSMRII
jgi:hypothetical protein